MTYSSSTSDDITYEEVVNALKEKLARTEQLQQLYEHSHSQRLKQAKEKEDYKIFLNAVTNGNLEIVKDFIEQEVVDVNQKDRLHVPLLIHAVSGKHSEITKLLLDANASVNAVDQNNWTALHVACISLDVEVVFIFINTLRISLKFMKMKDV